MQKTSERHLLEQSQSLFPRPNFVRLTKAQRPTRHIIDHTRYDIFAGMITNQNWNKVILWLLMLRQINCVTL